MSVSNGIQSCSPNTPYAISLELNILFTIQYSNGIHASFTCSLSTSCTVCRFSDYHDNIHSLSQQFFTLKLLIVVLEEPGGLHLPYLYHSVRELHKYLHVSLVNMLSNTLCNRPSSRRHPIPFLLHSDHILDISLSRLKLRVRNSFCAN